MKTISTPDDAGFNIFRIVIKALGIFPLFLVHAVYATSAVYTPINGELVIPDLHIYLQAGGPVSPFIRCEISLQQIGPRSDLRLLAGETEYELTGVDNCVPIESTGQFDSVFFVYGDQGDGYVPAVQFSDDEVGDLSYRLRLTLNSPGSPDSPAVLGVHVASLNGSHPPPNPLAALNCSDGQVIKWDDTASAWECADLTDSPSLACSAEQVMKWSSSLLAWQCAEDLNTDTLAGLGCSNGDVTKWEAAASAWVCATDTDTDTLTGLSCTGGQIAKWSSSGWECAYDSTGAASLTAGAGLEVDPADTLRIANNGVIDDMAQDNLTIINGSVNASIIGGSIPAQGTFTELTANGNVALGDAPEDSVTVNGTVQGDTPLVFDGATADANNTVLEIVDPTSGNIITLPDASGTVVLEQDPGCTNGQVLSSDGAGAWNCTTGSGGSGITDVIAGVGLTGGGSDGAVTLNVDFGTAAGQAAQGAHTHAAVDVSSGTLNNARLSADVAHVNVAETLGANWVNTANPWADNEVADNLTIDDGTVNNTVIGGSSPAAGTFSALTANGDVALGDAAADTVTVTGALTISSGAPGAGKVLTSDASGNAVWQSFATAGGDYWSLNGNGGTDAETNFVGTTDNHDLVFGVNSTQALRLRYNTVTPSLIGGFLSNNVTGGVQGATIGGGGGHVGTTNLISDHYGTIGGGSGNQAGNSSGTMDDSWLATVGGGFINQSTARFATIGGGRSNMSSDAYATVGGGSANTASATAATVGGGETNTASGNYATVAGGFLNAATGTFSFAAGKQAKAAHSGAFIWADAQQNTDFNSTAINEFAVRASGGVRLRTSANLSTGCNIAAGGGAWSCGSDRNTKENFSPADGTEILEKVAALPIETWNYKTQDDGIRHIGPMAQDFRAAFSLGENDTTISMVDADGVALAAIQGLYRLAEAQRMQLQSQQEQIEALQAESRDIRAALQRVQADLMHASR
ncbi:MAG: hypothetical protein GY862_28360 [Gammaproteobacteria bacterium]|nr:hypothetical protein [Gammaproteobacteria bacterium]